MVGGDVVGGDVVGGDVAGGDVVGGEVAGGAVGGGEVSGREVAGGGVGGGAVAGAEVLREVGGEVASGDVVAVSSLAETGSFAEADSLGEVKPGAAALESVLLALVEVAALVEAIESDEVGFVASTTDPVAGRLASEDARWGKMEADRWKLECE